MYSGASYIQYIQGKDNTSTINQAHSVGALCCRDIYPLSTNAFIC